MTALLVRKALRRSLDQVRYVTPVRPGQAQGLVATVYRQVERDFGMLAPPVALHSPAPGPLAGCWLMLRETLVAPGAAPRAARELVAAAVSLGNACPYCVAVHGATLHGLARSREAAAITGDGLESISDPARRALAEWARGGPEAAHAGVPVPTEQVPELVGVAVTFHYLNRMVNVFLDDTPLPPGVPAGAGDLLMKMLGRIMLPGRSAPGSRAYDHDLLPKAQLPDDLSWAAGNPGVADAFARAAATIDTAGLHSVPEPVRELVLAELAAWDGLRPGLGRSWLQAPVARLAPADRPAGRLALLTALASYQVVASDIADFRRDRPDDDEALVELTSWASMAAARLVGSGLTERLHLPT
jgi:AhpD family alkylhydroperoxidase